MDSRTVLLYGNSLLLALVADSLSQVPGVQVTKALTWDQACRQMAACEPDVLIFDLNDGRESHILSLLFKNPGPLLIGLDTETNQAVLVSGQETQSLTLGKVREIVFNQKSQI